MKCETTRPIFLRQKNSKKPFVPVSERISNMSFKQWIVSVLAVAACGLAPSFAAQPSIIIKFSHVVAADAPKGKAAEFFARRAAELTRGAVKVEVYANSSLFGDADEMAALQRGEVQMLAPSVSKFEAYTKQLQVFDLPFLFDDLEAVKRFQRREKSRELLRSMAGQNIYGLAFCL